MGRTHTRNVFLRRAPPAPCWRLHGRHPPETLTVWWVKGFYKAEDDALNNAIKAFEAKTGNKVELSQYPVQDMIPKTVAALDSGTPPDVAYADVYDFQVAGKWAFDGKLEDISDIIDADEGQVCAEHAGDGLPAQWQDQRACVLRVSAQAADYAHPVLEGHAATRRGSRNRTFRPVGTTTGIFGVKRSSRRCARRPGSASTASACRWAWTRSDSFYSFLTFMDAYNVKLVDDNGKLLVDDPKVKEGLIKALTSYVMPAMKGCAPPSATSWKDPGQQRRFP